MSQPEYMPTPDEIREACRQIREGWDAREELLRRVGPHNKRFAYRIPGENGPGMRAEPESS